MTTNTKTAPAVAPFTLTETADGLTVTCAKGRVKLDDCPVRFMGRDVHKDWREYAGADDLKGRDVSHQFHRARLVLSWYDGDDVPYGERKEHSRATVSGIEAVGYVCVVYRRKYVGRDADGEPVRAWGWEYDYESSYARRASSAFAPALPEGGMAALKTLAEAVAERAATPERLRMAEAQRLESIARQQQERADQLLRQRQEAQERASALFAQAAACNGDLMPADESEAERYIRNGRL